jgi:hypothetical protein
MTRLEVKTMFNAEKYTFTPNLCKIGSINGKESTETILSEPMLVGSFTIDEVRTFGGQLTNKILNRIFDIDGDKIYSFCEENSFIPVVTTRSFEFNIGYEPTGQGWHLDGIPKTYKHNNMYYPSLKAYNKNTFHYNCFVSDQDNGVSNTEFVITPCSLNIEIHYDIFWEMNNKINKLVSNKSIDTVFNKDGDINRFSIETIHRGSPAHTNGSRYFFRMSLIKSEFIRSKNIIRLYSDMSEKFKSKYKNVDNP